MGSAFLIFFFSFSFLWCPIMFLYVLNSVLWCALRFLHRNDVRFVFTSSCLYDGPCFIYIICVWFSISWAWHVSGITFIKYGQSQNNKNWFSNFINNFLNINWKLINSRATPNTTMTAPVNFWNCVCRIIKFNYNLILVLKIYIYIQNVLLVLDLVKLLTT